MRIYQATNTNRRGILLAARDETQAARLALEWRLVKSPTSLKLKDITESYIQYHGPDGFDLSLYRPGQLVKHANLSPATTWSTRRNPY